MPRVRVPSVTQMKIGLLARFHPRVGIPANTVKGLAAAGPFAVGRVNVGSLAVAVADR